MYVFVLDLDGTLIPSHEVDNVCYWRAVERAFGVTTGTLDLDAFENVTDSGILGEWSRAERGRDPHPAEVERVKSAFLDLLRDAARKNPESFRPLPGVVEWLDRVSARDDTAVAIATGGWSHSARFKLEKAGLDRYALPLGSADDSARRTDIMRAVFERLAPEPAAHCTYVGDGPWDLDCSRRLGWDFIGIASGERARTLVEAGAERVYPDFRELAALLSCSVDETTTERP